MFVHCCHCMDCQRQTGSAFVLNALIEADRVEILSGRRPRRSRCRPKAACRTTSIAAQNAGSRCGAPMAAARQIRFVRVGTLDNPAALSPDVHIYTRSKLPWVKLPEGVPAFEALLRFEERSGRRKALPGARRSSCGQADQRRCRAKRLPSKSRKRCARAQARARRSRLKPAEIELLFSRLQAKNPEPRGELEVHQSLHAPRRRGAFRAGDRRRREPRDASRSSRRSIRRRRCWPSARSG